MSFDDLRADADSFHHRAWDELARLVEDYKALKAENKRLEDLLTTRNAQLRQAAVDLDSLDAQVADGLKKLNEAETKLDGITRALLGGGQKSAQFAQYPAEQQSGFFQLPAARAN